MISDARGGHVSPGIYTEERDVTYSVKSLGITSLGLVGETLYGPAFENVEVENWGEYVDYFGGTSTEKFKGTDLPKYELPYIAKSYLEESKRLNVVRVLGLSGYYAGPAYTIQTAQTAAPVVVLRSKLFYGYDGSSLCEPASDMPTPAVKSIEIGQYEEPEYDAECVPTGKSTSGQTDNKKFAIIVTTNNVGGFGDGEVYKYNVSLNPADSNYIYKVIGTRADAGAAPIYIEAVYENSLGESAVTGVISAETATVNVTEYYKLDSVASGEGVYTGTYVIDDYNSSKSYVSLSASEVTISEETVTASATSESDLNKYISVTSSENVAGYADFREMYRPAQTPWIVSEVSATKKSDGTSAATLTKLFKFVTISDGEAANYQVKVSIQNIKPDEGTFDVVVRDFNDDDANPLILEKFSKCTLVEGDASYIAYKIGSLDGGYAAKSKYILVEMASDDDLSNHIPAGFLGYPMPTYGENRAKVKVDYNVNFDVTVKPRRQYFGLNRNILDADVLAYKGRYFYDNLGDANPDYITNGFHMDAILNKFDSASTFVDGLSGYVFTPVSDKKVGSETKIPRIINGAYMDYTIYRDVTARKFTTCFYGGFDGWDVNRTERTNTDEYKASRYNVSGSTLFGKVTENGLNKSLNLPSTAITTDYYAYLAGYRCFANPEDIDINIFATPGINWRDNQLLTEDVIDIIEDSEDGRGGDALYIMASPKDADVNDIIYDFADSEIDTSYAATYFPWVMYFDSSNKKYIDLPVTKDVVRNMAAVDNNSFPWFAPAGIQRGPVKCVKALKKTTLTDEDALYEAGINPIKSFAKDGVKVWGNKTTYSVESPLNRINVRRLMIRVKKLVSEAARHLIFEQYDDTLEKQFKGLVEPILADVKANRGIYDYRIITEITEETRDQHILPAKILIKPTPALEYISISFVVYPESVSFEEN